MSEPRLPVTFVLGLFGSIGERCRLLDAFEGLTAPDDEVIVVHGGLFPLEPVVAERVPARYRLLYVREAAIPVLYDRATVEAAHEHLVFVGPGGSPGPAGFALLRQVLQQLGTGAAQIETDHCAQASSVTSTRAILAVTRDVLRAIGGMTAYEQRARRSDSGLVGTGDLFDVVTHEIRRAGWPLRVVSVEAITHRHRVTAVAAPAPPVVPAAALATTELPASPTAAVPPSRHISDELRAALASSAAAHAQWFAQWLPPAQVATLNDLTDPGGMGAGTLEPDQGWTPLRFALFVAWRGQPEYAASALNRSDLSSLATLEEVVTAAQLMSKFLPFTRVLEKLRDAGPLLAEMIAAQNPEQARAMVTCWSAVDPTSPYLAAAQLRLGLVPSRQ